MLKALLMGLLGIVLGVVGLDPFNTRARLTFGLMELMDGVGLVPVVMGLFGISEVLLNIEKKVFRETLQTTIRGLLPSARDWAESKWALVRGTVVGFFMGILPGGGGVIASFISYAIEKKVSKHPECFGKGAIDGVAGPESANNAAAGGAFIPLSDIRPSNQCRYRSPVGCVDDTRRPAGSVIDEAEPGPFLGSDCEHVYRQCHALGAEPASDRDLG